MLNILDIVSQSITAGVYQAAVIQGCLARKFTCKWRGLAAPLCPGDRPGHRVFIASAGTYPHT